MAEPYLVAVERLMVTEKGKLVPAGHKDGARLFASPGERLSTQAVDRFSMSKRNRKAWFVGPPHDKAYRSVRSI